MFKLMNDWIDNDSFAGRLGAHRQPEGANWPLIRKLVYAG